LARSSLAAVGLAIGALLVSCTLTRKSVDECKTNAECRDAFGAGYSCGAGGFCAKAANNPRCTQTYPEDLLTRPQNYPGVFMIGSIMDRSVATQVDREAAIRLATMQVNDSKGLDGHSFGVVQCDAAENADYDSLKREDAAVADAQYLADVLGVAAIVGPSASGDAAKVVAAVQSAGTLIISPSASSPDLAAANPTDENPGLFWRTVASDKLQGEAISRHLVKTSPTTKSVVVIDEKGPYGTALAEVFTASFQKDGRTAKTSEFSNASERDAAIATATTPAVPYVLFFSSQTPDAVAFLNAASNLASYKDVQVFLTDSAANTDLLKDAAGAKSIFPRVVGSRPAIPTGPTFDLFKTSYSAAFKKDPSALGFAPQAYDATWMVFYGAAFSLRQEKALTGIGIARGLRKISSAGPEIPVTPANWTRIADAIGAGNRVNIDGASGKLDYDAKQETTSPIDIWKISADGQSIESVTQIDPSLPE
jgi:branched-chain amino acid transport system substrate-binding protein